MKIILFALLFAFMTITNSCIEGEYDGPSTLEWDPHTQSCNIPGASPENCVNSFNVYYKDIYSAEFLFLTKITGGDSTQLDLLDHSNYLQPDFSTYEIYITAENTQTIESDKSNSVCYGIEASSCP